MRQIKQIRKGLKETMLWPLISEHPDVASVIFPRESGAVLTPQVNSSVKTSSFGQIWKLIVKSGNTNTPGQLLTPDGLSAWCCMCSAFWNASAGLQ